MIRPPPNDPVWTIDVQPPSPKIVRQHPWYRVNGALISVIIASVVGGVIVVALTPFTSTQNLLRYLVGGTFYLTAGYLSGRMDRGD